MKQLLWILSFSILTVACTKPSAENKAENQEKTYQLRLDSLLDAYETNNTFMGSVTLLQGGEIRYEKAIGYEDQDANKKAQVSTKYRIGSVNKTYTAVLTFKAIEEGLLQLNQTLDEYFPNIENASSITIAQLLQHRSGIPNFVNREFFNYRTEYKSREEIFFIITNLTSEFEPGSQGDYSNSNYFLLALILEKVYGETYEQLLQKQITGPLNLTNTYSGDQAIIGSNEAQSYTFENDWKRFKPTHLSVGLGTGSMISTSTELATFLHGLFNGSLLSEESLKQMQTIEDTYGMGLMRYTIGDRRGFGHRGTLDGFKSTGIYFPKEKVTLVITSNASRDNINQLYSEVLSIYFNDAPVEISEEEVKKFVGTYNIPVKDKDGFRFVSDKNQLILMVMNEFSEPLTYKGDNRFVFEQLYAESFSFTFSDDGKEVLVEQGDYSELHFKK